MITGDLNRQIIGASSTTGAGGWRHGQDSQHFHHHRPNG
jgi:hypothetical protein